MAAGTNSVFSWLKNLFFVMLFLQFAPTLFFEAKKKMIDFSKPKIYVGLLPIRGEIKNVDWHIRHLKQFVEDDSIKAIVAKIDCPGGYPAASQALFLALMHAKTKKPLIVEIQNVACSGGYYAAVAADHIIALPSSLVGNIGVIMQLINLKKAVEYCNAGVEYIKSGDYKAVGSQFLDLTPEQRMYLQSTSDDIYVQFLTDVATQRGLELAKQKEWADGKAFTGKQGFALGLVDQLGGHAEVVKALQERLKTEDEIRFVSPEAPSLMQRITGEDDYSEGVSSSYFPLLLSRLISYVLKSQQESLGHFFS